MPEYLSKKILKNNPFAVLDQDGVGKLIEVAVNGGNIFEELMSTVQKASLGQITNALYEVGGQYRRNM